MKTHGKLFILLSAVSLVWFPPASATGQIYKWVDENGVVSYSNVAPPEGETDVGIIEETEEKENTGGNESPAPEPVVAGPAGQSPLPGTTAADPAKAELAEKVRAAHQRAAQGTAAEPGEKPLTPEEMEELERTAPDEAVKAKPLRKKYLTQRIERTRQSIEQIEKEIEKHPNDEALREALRAKKEYLRKYQRAAETGNY